MKSIVFIALLLPAIVQAADEERTNFLKGAAIVPSTVLTTADPVFGTAQWSDQQAYKVNNVLQFEIDFFNTANYYFYNQTFTATCSLQVKCYSNPLNPATYTTKNISLTVNYNPATGAQYKGMANVKFEGAYKVEAEIISITPTGITTSKPIFLLTNRLVVTRQYHFNPATSDVTKYFTADGKKLRISWEPTNYPGAEEFDLEYTYIDEMSEAGDVIKDQLAAGTDPTLDQSLLDECFKNNSTRINLSRCLPGVSCGSYELNLNYNQGFVLYRIRGVQYRYTDGLRLEGQWNYVAEADDYSTEDFFEQGVVPVNWHLPDLNWQYNATFAEEGKRKEVLSYFDGTLRSRQMVTINNADDKVVIAETVYDALGRPAMNILPTPHNSNFLEYYPSFNMNTESVSKPVSYKDLPEADCELIPGMLNAASGAEKYYSSNNPFTGDATKPWNNLIPRADGYPYSVVQYTPDNTGRVRAQGGVGKQYQIGGANYNTSGLDHTTRYFYGKPGSQYELDRLFGYEAGDLNHYMKNMTVDANGQVSVSYINSEGKTVATALAGLVPGNVEGLEGSSQPSSTVKDIILNTSSFKINNARSSLEASATFLAPTAGEYKFTYHFDADQYRYTTALSQTLCYSCSYDILITVKDACGSEPPLLIEAEKNVIPANTSCTPPGDQSKELSVQIPKTGEYTVYFELVVSKAVLDDYTDHYIQNNTDLKTFRQFLLEQLVEENLEECYSDCEACKTVPDNPTDFLPIVRAYYEKENILFDQDEIDFATELWGRIRDNCGNFINCDPSPCDDMLEILMQDVTPGNQYAEYSADYYIVNPQINVLSWYQSLWFKDRQNIDITVENDAGQMVNPSQLPLKEFILKFEDEWAYTLVKKHPEYCYYLWCTENSDSKRFDDRIEHMTPEEAVNSGYYQQGDPLSLFNIDPFFQSGYGTAYQSQMTDDLQNYSSNVLQYGGSTKGMSQTIDYFLYCVKAQPSVSWDNCNGSPTGCRSTYLEWQLFKQWYLDLKLKYYTQALRDNNRECTNCFIPITQGGSNPVDWSGCIAPPLSAFTVEEIPNSTADGTKRLLIKYRDGNEAMMWPLSLRIELKDDITAVTVMQDIIFVPGFGSQEMMVPANFDIFTLKAVACAQVSTDADFGKPAKDLKLGTEWNCPTIDDQTLTVSYQKVSGTTIYEVKVCYTGPAIPSGKVVNIRARLYTLCDTQVEMDFQFCSTSPACIIKPLDVPDCAYLNYAEIRDISCADEECNEWECPEANETSFITQVYELDATHRKLTLCYNGPSIPQGKTIFLNWVINIGCETISYPVMFCATSPTCITKNIVLKEGCSGPEMSLENVECIDSECEWRCPGAETNYRLEYYHNPVSTAWEAKICYVGPPIPIGRAVDVWVNLGGCILGGAVDYMVTFSNAVTCHTRTFTLDTKCETVDFTIREIKCRELESNPCPGARDFALSTSSQGTCNPNGQPGLPVTINIDYLGGTLVLNPPLYRVKVTVVITVRERFVGGTFTETHDVWFTNGSSSENICVAYNENFEVIDMVITGIECTGPCPSGECCDDPRYGLYTGKIRRFQDYVAPDFESAAASLNSGNMDFTGYPVIMCKTECESMADGWIESLKGCTNDPVLLEQVRRKLIDVCQQSCVAQSGTSTIYPYSDVNPTPSFESVISQALGGATPDCSEDLISHPYPWGKAPVGNRTYATETNNDICKRFDELKNECINKGYGSSNQDLHTYLETFYADYYDLTLEDLDDIENSCKNCNGILDMPVELPLFMDGNAKPCIDCDKLREYRDQFLAKYPSITTSHPNYEELFANFINHKTGFSYSYSKYAALLERCDNDAEFNQNGKICELPQQLEAEINLVNQCIEEKFYNAYSNATTLYAAYIEEKKQEFRNAYMAKCLSADPYMESEAILYEYHYTLYYYDQSGNLVKTVPPAGVVFLDDPSIATLQTDRTQYIVPQHTLATVYKYNSFNQVTEQTSPDGGTSYFWYDNLGRLVISQNEEQRNPVVGNDVNRYSYTLYDLQGRIKEVGEKLNGDDISTVDTKNEYSLAYWLGTGTDIQITETIYDKANTSVVTNTTITNEQDDHVSRKRVVTTLFRKQRYPSPETYDAATHYKYDINGNAVTVWQENARLQEIATMTGGLKRIDYDFDLVSGKVNKVYYQKGKSDQFIYKYHYDAENRVIASESSRDDIVWQKDARYDYYLHGPLARTELGTWRVQGTDYAYTLQGWMKHINAPVLKHQADISHDGDQNINNFKLVSRDAMGYMLQYNEEDYRPVNDANPLYFSETIPSTAGTGNNLYNGNIRAVTLQLAQIDPNSPVTYSYRYDQLNRLVRMRMHQSGLDVNTDPATLTIGSPLTEYAEDISYDANGNIDTYVRKGNATATDMDELDYDYISGSNKLKKVADNTTFTGNYTEDIDNYSGIQQYEYDNIGNLVRDKTISATGMTIEWTVYGKIKKIVKPSAFGAPTTIEYEYDASGNRIYKKVTLNHGGNHTFYVRDAQGNVLAVYKKGFHASTPVRWEEQHLYGSSRIGVRNINEQIDPPFLTLPGDVFDGFEYGKTAYELANHLGNVMVTISDKKVGVELNSSGTVDYFKADVMTANDYYPFGMLMPGRHYDNGSQYRYGFNGKENDNDVSGDGNIYDYGFRIYNPRIGKFLSVDPLTNSYPWYTPYQFAGNSPIRKIDLDGLEEADPPAFKNFDKKTVEASVEARIKDPSKIDQNKTGLCGMAGIANILATIDPQLYKSLVLGLFQDGSATNTNTGYTIRADQNAFGGNHLLNKDPNSSSYPSIKGQKMDQADFILLASLKDGQNHYWDYNGNADSRADQFSGISMPSGIASLMKDFLGFTNVENNTNLFFSKGGSEQLKKIDEFHQKGEHVMMFVNSGMLQNKTWSLSANHWIVYKGGLKIDEQQKTVQFKAFSWGSEQTYTMSFEVFRDNFYGTVKGKMKDKED